MSRRPARCTEAEMRRASRTAKAEGMVYFIQGFQTGNVKIGFATDPVSRMASLQTGSSEKLSLLGTVPGSVALEREFHARFAGLRLCGEWFRPAPELQAFIREKTGNRVFLNPWDEIFEPA